MRVTSSLLKNRESDQRQEYGEKTLILPAGFFSADTSAKHALPSHFLSWLPFVMVSKISSTQIRELFLEK